MKKHIIIIAACLISGAASGATSGFITECDAYVQYVSCVSGLVMNDLSAFSCDQITSGTNNGFKNYDNTFAVNECKRGFPMILNPQNVGDRAVKYVQTYLWDRCAVPDDDSYLFTSNAGIANDVIRQAMMNGYCTCNEPGYYVLARGVTPTRWAIDAECRPCPGGGTTDAVMPLGLEACWMPAGTFSDETGSGTYSDRCYASYESEQEIMDAYK